MKFQLILAALLAVALVQVTESEANPTSTTEPDDADTPVSVLIPLADSYNMSTRWLGDLRGVYLEIFRSEARTRQENARSVANSIRLLANPYKQELGALVAKAVEKDLVCARRHMIEGLQLFKTMDNDLMKCTEPLVHLIERYDDQIDKLFKNVSAQSEVDIYTKCLPTEPTLTKKILERAETCFQREYQLAVDNVYYPTGLEIFTLVTEMSRTFAKVESVANVCGLEVVQRNEATLTKIIEDIRTCAMPEDGAHSRQRRGLGKKLKKGWKKVRNGAKKVLNRFCSKKPCMLPPITIPIPGK